MRQVDARFALVRNAVFADSPPPRVSPLARRASEYEKLVAWAESKYPVTDDLREQ